MIEQCSPCTDSIFEKVVGPSLRVARHHDGVLGPASEIGSSASASISCAASSTMMW